MHVLVINSGSSSIKFSLYDMQQETLRISGAVEQIGEINSHAVYRDHTNSANMVEHKVRSPVMDHATGLQQMIEFLEHNNHLESIHTIGHRIVHGGEQFQTATIINDDVIKTIREMIPLAPLHNPANLAGIEAMHQHYPHVPQVAVFDTAFFQSLPPHAYRYAIPTDLYQQHQVRRYGFHGISHQYVAREAARHLQRPLETLRLITLHLGNGASVAAIHGGVCVDTSMGMTPLAGLVMGTRCGDLDPAIPSYLARTLGMNLDEVEILLNHDSGMKGLCGVSDMREVHQLANKGDERAHLAIEMFCYRIVKYIGAYYTILGSLDALVFTGGIGENDAVIRQIICDKAAILGITLDQALNQTNPHRCMDISAADSKIKILVIPTDEELEIARQTSHLTTRQH